MSEKEIDPLLVGGSASGTINIVQGDANDIPEDVTNDVTEEGEGEQEEEESDDEHYGTPTSSQNRPPPPVLLDPEILDQDVLAATGEVVVNDDNAEELAEQNIDVADMIADTGDYKITSTQKGRPKICHEGYW